jgi:hypothetical protein
MYRESENSYLWQSRTRYYMVQIERDLLGDLVISRYWGGRFNRRGGVVHEVMTSPGLAERRILEISARRARHGYVLVLS